MGVQLFLVKEEGRLFLECGGVWCVREEEGSIQTGVHGVHGKQTCENRVLNWCVSPVSEQSES